MKFSIDFALIVKQGVKNISLRCAKLNK